MYVLASYRTSRVAKEDPTQNSGYNVLVSRMNRWAMTQRSFLRRYRKNTVAQKTLQGDQATSSNNKARSMCDLLLRIILLLRWWWFAAVEYGR